MWLALIPLGFIAVCEAYFAGAVFGPSVMVGRSAELTLAACCLGAAFMRPTLSRLASVAANLAAVAMVWQFAVWCLVTEVHEPGSLWMAERLAALVSAVGLSAIIIRGTLPGWTLGVGFAGAMGALLALWQYGLVHWKSLYPTVAERAHDHPLSEYQDKAHDALVNPWSYPFSSFANAEWPQFLTHWIMACAQPVAWIALIVVAAVFFVRQIRPVPPHTREAWLWRSGPPVPLQAPALPSTTLAARVEGAAWGLALAGCGTYALAVGGEMPDYWDAGKRSLGVVMGVWVEPPFGNCNFTSGGAAPLVGLAVVLAIVQIARWVRGKGPKRRPVEISILLLVAVGIGIRACYAMGTGEFNGDVVRAVSVDAASMAAFSLVFLCPRRFQLPVALLGCIAIVTAQVWAITSLLPNQPAPVVASATPGDATPAAAAPSATPATATSATATSATAVAAATPAEPTVASALDSDTSHGLKGIILRHLGKAPSTVWRILWWRLAAGACFAEPWHGYGPGATLAVLPDRPGFDKTWLVVPCYGEHAHHEPLEVIMDGGFPLFLMLMACVGFTVAPLWRRRHQGVPAALLITWAGVAGNSLVDCHLSQPGPVMFLGLLAGVSWAAASLPEGDPDVDGSAAAAANAGLTTGPITDATVTPVAPPLAQRLPAIVGGWAFTAVALFAVALMVRQAVLEFHDGGAPDMVVLRAQSRIGTLYENKDFAGYRAEKHTLRERLGPLDDLAFQEAWAAWRDGKLADADALAIEEARRLAPHEANLNLLAILIDIHHRRNEDASADTAAYRAAIERVRELLAQVPEDDKNHAEYEKLKNRLRMPIP